MWRIPSHRMSSRKSTWISIIQRQSQLWPNGITSRLLENWQRFLHQSPQAKRNRRRTTQWLQVSTMERFSIKPNHMPQRGKIMQTRLESGLLMHLNRPRHSLQCSKTMVFLTMIYGRTRALSILKGWSKIGARFQSTVLIALEDRPSLSIRNTKGT